MKDNPLIVGLLIALIVILVIAGVSLLVKTNDLSSLYKKEVANKISYEKDIEDLKVENVGLIKNIKNLDIKIENLELEASKQIEIINEENSKKIDALKEDYSKLEKLKEKLEDNLKDELMKQQLQESAK